MKRFAAAAALLWPMMAAAQLTPPAPVLSVAGRTGNVTLDVGDVAGGNASAAVATAPGSTTARSLGARAGEMLNVKDYGARGDGVTDDTAAIQAAATAVPAAGATLLFPPGNYLMSGAATLASNTTVRGQGATVTAAPASVWANGQVQAVLKATGAANLAIEEMRFAYPHGTAAAGAGAAAHIIGITNGANVVIRHNIADGGGDFNSIVGGSNVLVDGNTVTNTFGGCFDFWGGATQVRVVNNFCAMLPETGLPGVDAISFSGMNTDNSPANTAIFYASGNTLYMNADNGGAITVNALSGSGTDDKVIIEGNHIFIGAKAWGILVSGVASNGIIANNTIEATVGATYGAVNVYAPATHWSVVGNVAVNVPATLNGDHAVFSNGGTGGLLANNESYGGGTLLGTIGTGVLVYGNDTGTGTLALGTATAATPGPGDNSTRVATTAFVAANAPAPGAPAYTAPNAAGTWLLPMAASNGSSIVPTSGRMVLLPFYVPPGSAPAKTLSIRFASAPSAAYQFEGCVYAMNATTGLPGLLVAGGDATATSTGTSTANAVAATFPSPLALSGWYWGGVLVGGTASGNAFTALVLPGFPRMSPGAAIYGGSLYQGSITVGAAGSANCPASLAAPVETNSDVIQFALGF